MLESLKDQSIDITVSWSELSAYRTCPMRHWLDYRQRQPRDRTQVNAATLGTRWHSMMQAWYQGRGEGRWPELLAVEVPAAFLTWTPSSDAEQDMLSTLLWMWDGFLLTGDPFADCQVLGVEQEWRTELPRIPGQPANVTFWLKTIVDLVAQRGPRLLVVDHKSQAKHMKPADMTRDMDVEDQLGLYLWTAGEQLNLPAHRMSACWSYACTTDLKKEPRPPEQRFWLAWSARRRAALAVTAREAAETALAAYARPLDVEPPRHTSKDHCRWCDHRAPCYVGRDRDRPVELQTPTRADQAPKGIHREGY